MCLTCNPEVQRNYQTDFHNPSQIIKITYYCYNGYFKYCCLEDYFRTKRMLERGPINQAIIAHWFEICLNYKDHLTLYYKKDIVLVHKFGKIPNGKFILGRYNSSLEINIINITNDIINCSDLCNELEETKKDLDKTKNELKDTNELLEETNNELEETKNENKLLKEENIELINKNIILKKEVEYFNSLKPKYNYLEITQNKKNLHNEYKRIYKLIKKNIGFNLC